jgi:hypothetical protein
VQTCAVCHLISNDEVPTCPRCGSDLRTHSETARALQRLRDDGRFAKVRIIQGRESCPACKAAYGAYPIDRVPELPIEGCSHPHGCRCRYEPVLDLVGP